MLHIDKKIKIKINNNILDIEYGTTFSSLVTKDKKLFKKICHLKHFISQRYFWEGCVCCGAPKIKYYQLKIADIDGQSFIGCFRNLNYLIGKRISVIQANETMTKQKWAFERQMYQKINQQKQQMKVDQYYYNQ